MVTATLPTGATRRADTERWFFTGAALAMLVVTFAGFAPSYYLAPLTGAPAVPPIVHLHAAVFTGWMLLYAGQNLLVFGDRRDLHRKLGIAGAILVPALVIVGYATVIMVANPNGGVAGRVGRVPILFPLAAVLGFGVLATLGLAWRSEPVVHKRLMLLATTSLIVTPFARLARMAGSPLIPPINGMILADTFVVALVLFDCRTRGHLHRTTAWAGGILLASQPLRVAINASDWWHAIAARLIA